MCCLSRSLLRIVCFLTVFGISAVCYPEAVAATAYKVRPVLREGNQSISLGTDGRFEPRINNNNAIMIRFPDTTQTADDTIPVLIWKNGTIYQPIIVRPDGHFIRIGDGFNDSEQIVGWHEGFGLENAISEAFIADRDSYQALPWIADTLLIQAEDINNSGHVIGKGTINIPGFGLARTLVEWRGGAPITYTTGRVFRPDSTSPDGGMYYPLDHKDIIDWDGIRINDADQLLGEFRISGLFGGGQDRAFSFGVFPDSLGLPRQVPLFPPSGVSAAIDLASNGDIVGRGFKNVDTTGGVNLEQHAFLYKDLNLLDLHPPTDNPLANSSTIAVNSLGQVLMFSQSGQWLYDNGEHTKIFDLELSWHGDSTYRNQFGTEIQPFVNGVYDMNESGVILGFCTNPHDEVNYSLTLCLLFPENSNLTVNSVGDLPDTDPSDGNCSTGNLVNGESECTLRAALMESNFRNSLDTIDFSIPGGGTPKILLNSELPEITDPVVIDGSTQISSDRIEIDGIQTGLIDGLTISSGKTDISHLVINNFAGNGLVLKDADSNHVTNLYIGVGIDGATNRGNAGYGVYVINSSGNTIGEEFFGRGNIIAYNGQSGVYVQSGTGNSIRGNQLFANGGLGIDLASEGVSANDNDDADSGANSLQNYPVIDSVNVGLTTTIWGTLNTAGDQSYEVDIYLSDSCDPTGFGEGKTLIQSASIIVGADGRAEFSLEAFASPSRGQFLSATATDSSGSTSEFSPCVSANFIRLVDELGEPITDKTFAMYKVAYDPPDFSETFVDTVSTDSLGIVDLTQYNIVNQDSLRFTRELQVVASPKRVTSPKTALSLSLDNAQFDSSSSKMSYFEPSDDMLKNIKMSHTTIAINLFVSIEFDATVAYVNNLQNAFGLASNYLYDVTDGQVRLDTVVISDNGAGWNIADIWVHASNMEWPRAVANGLLTTGPRVRLHMPRKFYGNKTANRNQSALENPLNTATPNSYRTLIHELGHYALGFYDEYVFTNALGQCLLVSEYGYMDSQYPGGVLRSEMSSAGQYIFPGCQNTKQFSINGNSCWEHLELTYQKTYDGVLAPIIIPEERGLPDGQFNLLGPNDNLGSPDVNVGAKIVFPIVSAAPGIPPKRYLLLAADGVTPAANVAVTQHIVASGKPVKQGRTADDGRIYFMGAPSVYTYSAAGVSALTRASPGARASSITDFSWNYGSGIVPAIDDGSIKLSSVQGEFPLIPSVALDNNGISYSLRPLNQFSSAPSLVTRTENQIVDSSDLQFNGSAYTVTIPDTSSSDFDFTIYALDNASESYFFGSVVSISALNDAGSENNTAGSPANFTLSLDTTVDAAKQVILSTDYPPIRNGLTPSQLQAGKVGVLQIFPPVTTLTGFNTLQIRYPEGSLESNGIDSSLELTLRVHHWDEELGSWTAIGGSVDTSQNQVTVKITEFGTYALFTTDFQTDIGDDAGDSKSALPKRFEIKQNFPNPFNPTTVISYSMPVRAEVSIAIYNILGQRVKLFEQGQQSAGEHSVTWHATDERGEAVASGMYFYKVTAGEFSASQKMVLLK